MSHERVLTGASEVPPSWCHKCGTRLDRASTVVGDPQDPRRGDYTLCIQCGAINVFNDLLQLCEPTQAQLQVFEATPELVEQRSALLQALELTRHRYRKNQP